MNIILDTAGVGQDGRVEVPFGEPVLEQLKVQEPDQALEKGDGGHRVFELAGECGNSEPSSSSSIMAGGHGIRRGAEGGGEGVREPLLLLPMPFGSYVALGIEEYGPCVSRQLVAVAGIWAWRESQCFTEGLVFGCGDMVDNENGALDAALLL